MKPLHTLLLLLSSLSPLFSQPTQLQSVGPTLYFTLTDSSQVTGRVVRQDSTVIVVRQRGGTLTYLQPQQIARTTLKALRRTPRQQTDLVAFRLKDSTTVVGYVVERTPLAVVVRQPTGAQTYIDPGDIIRTTRTPVTVQPREAIPTASVAAPYLLSSRTAYTPAAGQVYYRNTYLLRNEVEVGLTEGWSVGAVINPLWTGLFDTSEYLANAVYANSNFGTQLYTQFGLPIGSRLRVGAGLTALLQRPPYFGQTRTSWLGQVLVSVGEPHTHVNLSYSFELSDNYSLVEPSGTLSVGAKVRLNPTLSFVSDNTIRVKRIFSNQLARVSAALRIQSRRHAIDVGVLSTLNAGFFDLPTYRVYPYAGYIVQFGR
jgi:hypothetical protein